MTQTKIRAEQMAGVDGWTAYSAVTPTRASADDPTYVLTFAGVDLTSTMSVGMKLKWTQNSTVRYGIITAISFSTNTTLTLYGGTDYDVDDTASFTISAFNYSTSRSPLGFPLTPSLWTAETVDTTNRQQNTPTAATWYNVGPLTVDVPIGSWKGFYQGAAHYISGSADSDFKMTLSTANNSESDASNTATYSVSADGTILLLSKNVDLTLTTKDTYYLNMYTARSSVTSIRIRGDLAATVIRFVCAYL